MCLGRVKSPGQRFLSSFRLERASLSKLEHTSTSCPPSRDLTGGKDWKERQKFQAKHRARCKLSIPTCKLTCKLTYKINVTLAGSTIYALNNLYAYCAREFHVPNRASVSTALRRYDGYAGDYLRASYGD